MGGSADTSGRGRAAGAWAGRVALLLAGSMISTACYAVTIRATLGLGPLYVLQDGFARQVGISVGASVSIIGYCLIAVALCLRSWPGPGTLALPIIGGAALNAMLPHIPAIHAVPLRLAAVLVATWFMALGGAMTIRASVGCSAYDAVMLGLGRILGKPLAPIRLVMEATVFALGWVLGGAVGVGTVCTGLLIGPGLQFWLGLIGDPRRADPDVEPATALRAAVPGAVPLPYRPVTDV